MTVCSCLMQSDDLITFAFPKAACLPQRTDVQCLHRWQKVLNPELVKGSWTEEVRINCPSHISCLQMCFCLCGTFFELISVWVETFRRMNV